MLRSKMLFLLVMVGALYSVGCTKKSSEGDVLHVDKGFSFPKDFPPDPGEVGKKTIEGVDSDRDGVRDDVQRWIYARFPDDESKRKALGQMARSYQADLVVGPDDKDLDAINRETNQALACMEKRFPKGIEDVVEGEYVQAKVLNTRQRTEQFLRTSSRFSGRTLGGGYDGPTPCDP